MVNISPCRPTRRDPGGKGVNGHMRIFCNIAVAAALGLFIGAPWPQNAPFAGAAALAMQPSEAADQAAEAAAERAAEQAAEAAAEQAAESAAEQAAESAADQAAESAAEAAGEDAAAEAAERAAEQAAEAAAEAALEKASEAAEAASEQAAEDAAGAAADRAAEQATNAALEAAANAGEAHAGNAPENPGEANAAKGPPTGAGPGEKSAGGKQLSNVVAAIDFDPLGERIFRDERVLVLPLERAAELDTQDFVIESKPLEGLGLLLARVSAPAGSDLARETPSALPKGDDIALDYNHIYTPEQSAPPFQGEMDATPVSFVRDKQSAPARSGFTPKVGLIDTDVQTDHAAFKASIIQKADFTGGSGALPSEHGTSVASALVGRDDAFSGLLPEARLYAASVFVEHPAEGVIASTASLVEALDWMAANDVSIINMSLAGPANRVIEAAIARAAEKGVIIIAAAGNGGPAGSPRFPAAYDNVIAVTAVNREHRVYRHAARGPHIDFAGPGVDILLASSSGGYATVSGTSIAAPFVTGVVALRCAEPALCADHEALVGALSAEALDLGDEGFDAIYGNGLILP